MTPIAIICVIVMQFTIVGSAALIARSIDRLVETIRQGKEKL